MPFDILGYQKANKDYYGDTPLIDVAKDVYEQDFKDRAPDFETWKKSAGIDPILQDDTRRRNPTIEDKLRDATAHVAPVLGENPKVTDTLKPPKEETSIGGELIKGAKSGWLNANQSVGQILEYAGKLTGIKPVEDVGKTANEFWGKEMEPNAAAVSDIRDINSWHDFGKWAAWNIGQTGSQLATIAPFLAMGGGEAEMAKGGFTVLGDLLRGNPGAATQFGKFVGQWARLKPMDIPVGILEGGQVLGGQLEALKKGEIEELHPIRGLAASFVATKLEELGDVMAVNKLIHGIGGKPGNLIARIAKEAVGVGLGEASEEFFQQYAEQFGINPKDITSKEQFMQAVNGAAAGFIGGAAIGGGTGALNQSNENIPANNEAGLIQRLQAGAYFSGLIDTGLKTGQANNKPFAPNDAIQIIRAGRKEGIFDETDIDRFREKYPQLMGGLNDVVTESLMEKVTQVAAPEIPQEIVKETNVPESQSPEAAPAATATPTPGKPPETAEETISGFKTFLESGPDEASIAQQATDIVERNPAMADGIATAVSEYQKKGETTNEQVQAQAPVEEPSRTNVPRETAPEPGTKTFVENKIRQLGNIEAVNKFYSGKDTVSDYARTVAPKILGEGPASGGTGEQPSTRTAVVDTSPESPAPEGGGLPASAEPKYTVPESARRILLALENEIDEFSGQNVSAEVKRQATAILEGRADIGSLLSKYGPLEEKGLVQGGPKETKTAPIDARKLGNALRIISEGTGAAVSAPPLAPAAPSSAELPPGTTKETGKGEIVRPGANLEGGASRNAIRSGANVVIGKEGQSHDDILKDYKLTSGERGTYNADTGEFTPAPKQPWGMTLAEFRKTPGILSDAQAYAQHFVEVQKALSEGKPVPPEVLKDYPDLQPKVKAPEISGQKPPHEMTRAEYRTAENAPKVEAIQKAIRQGKPITVTTNLRATKLAKPEHIRLASDGTAQIPSGRKWVNLVDDQLNSLAEQAGMKIPAIQERIYHHEAVKQAIQEGKAVPENVRAEYPDLKNVKAKKAAQTVVEPTKAEEKNVVTPKEQKVYVLEKTDDLITAARERWKKENDYNGKGTLTDKEIDENLMGKGTWSTNAVPEDAKIVVIDVPGDGTFKVPNDLKSLLNFRRNVKSRMTISTTPSKGGMPTKPSKPVGKSTDLITKEAQAEVDRINQDRENAGKNYTYLKDKAIPEAEVDAAKWCDIQGDVRDKTRTLKSLAEEFKGHVPSGDEVDLRAREAREHIGDLDARLNAAEKYIRDTYPSLAKEMFEAKPEAKAEPAPNTGDEGKLRPSLSGVVEDQTRETDKGVEMYSAERIEESNGRSREGADQEDGSRISDDSRREQNDAVSLLGGEESRRNADGEIAETGQGTEGSRNGSFVLNAKDAGWTLSDVQRVFKGQEVIQPNPNGPIYIKTRGGFYFTVESVNHISPDEVNFKMAYGREIDQKGETIAGSYGEGVIRLVRDKAGVWTLRHESIHLLEDVGILTPGEIGLLSRHIKILVANGKFKTANQKDVGGSEDRANFLAVVLTKEHKGILARITGKIREFIDRIMEAFSGRRTVRGIRRDILSGKVFNRPLTERPASAIGYAVTPKEGTGETTTGKTPRPAVVDFSKDAEWHDIAYANPTKESLSRLKKWLKDNPNAIVRMYHGTDASLPIETQGLKPTRMNTAKSLQSRHGVVSLSIYPGQAQTFGDMAYPGKTVQIYAVDVPVNRLIPDADQLRNKRMWGENKDIGRTLADSIAWGHGAQVKGAIPADWITKVDEKGNIPPETTPKAVGGKVKIVYDDRIPEGLDGYYNEKTDTIHVSTKLTSERQTEIIRHETEHRGQTAKGDLPQSLYVNPQESIKGFMEYFTDPSEVSARAVEKGEPISEIWQEVFRLRDQSISGEITEAPLQIETIVPTVDKRWKPDREIPIDGSGRYTDWSMRRVTGQLRKSDPKPILEERKSIRIYLKNNGNGIIAESKLKALGIEAFSNAPFSVDVPVTAKNTAKLKEIGIEIKDHLGLPNPSRPPKGGGEQYAVEKQTDPPVSKDPKVLNFYLKDETDAIVQTFLSKLHPGSMSWLETMLKSPEWFSHPQIQNIVKLFMRDRSEIYHETFNELNKADNPFQEYDTVAEAAKALKRKGLTLAETVSGKVSPEYQNLQKILDEGDTTWRRDTARPLPEQLKKFEDHIRKQGATDDTIAVWKLYRESYDKALDLQTQQLRDMIDQITEEAAFKGQDPDLEKLKKTLKGALAMMEEWKGFYVPRIREQGNWKVQAFKEHGPMSANKEFYREHAGSELAARRIAKRLQREGWIISNVGEVERLPEDIYQDVNAVATAKLIDTALEKMSSKVDLEGDLTAKFNEEVLRAVADEIKARGFRSHMIHRTEGSVIRGFIEDPIKRHLLYLNQLSGGISKARVAKMAMDELLGKKVAGKQEGGIDPVTDSKAYGVATNYIREQLRNMDASDRMIGLAKSIATFKFLGFNLRSLAVNMTAIATTAPAAIHQYAMDGKGSMFGIMRELGFAGKDYAALMAGKRLANADEQRFMDDVKKKGWDDAQYTREALGEMSKIHSKIWATLMDGSMYLFGKSEQWNRGTTMLAAYRVARKTGMAHAAAAEAAKTASDKAHGVYGKATMPMWAQGANPAAKIGQMAYVYAKFGHSYLQMLYDMGLKKHNIKAAMFAFLSPLVLAGGAALPFKDALFAIFGALFRPLFGDGWDPEKWVWDTIREHLGTGAEKIGRHGLTGAAGLDISGSLSIGVGIPKNFIDLTGAVGGVATEGKEAWDSLMEGRFGRAAEHALPSGLANPLRAYRESVEGATTRNKRRVWDEEGKPFVPSAGETAARAFGFRSTNQAVLSERTWEGHKEQTAFADKRNAIYERFRAWTLGGRDRDEYREIVKQVQEYNDQIAKQGIRGVSRITSQSLRDQAKRMQRPSKNERALLS